MRKLRIALAVAVVSAGGLTAAGGVLAQAPDRPAPSPQQSRAAESPSAGPACAGCPDVLRPD